MKRSACLLFGLLLAVASGLDAQDIRFTTSAVQLRADADAKSKAIATVPRGARVTLQVCAVRWCRVEYRGKAGYIAEGQLANAPGGAKKAAGDGYMGVKGSRVASPNHSAVGAPRGATARCRDGTYSFSQSRSGTCSAHGGVARWL